jgi:hypothetical protein
MPTPSKVSLLPEALRAELEQWITRNGFSGYQAAAAWLAARGLEMGLRASQLPRRSALQDYGAKLRRKIEAIADGVRASKIIAEAAPDDEAAMAEAVIRLVQDRLFSLLVDSKIDPKVLQRPGFIGAVADLTRASLLQKKWRRAVRSKAERAAERVAGIAAEGGLSSSTVATIRREILGIAG